jgi:hypothetical protein
MFSPKRVRLTAAALVVAATSGGIAAAMITTASASPGHAGTAVSARAAAHGPKLSLERFDLNGYVINADYSLGRNTGNTFQQTYKDSMVQGVPIEGPYVGTTFPPEDYVALPIGHHELYVAWLDPQSNAIVDVFVMNFASHIVYDYAPGSNQPESAGTITVVHRGADPLP